MKFLFLMLPLALMAKPSGMQTISGKASCNEQAGTVVIESGKRAVVKWDEFSIGKGEKVRFNMPDQKSAILNRVGGVRSEILGQMESNGKVYLLNPKGVLIGKEAVIHTASFVASSLDVLDQDFLRGDELLFSGDSQASVVNLGTISCLQGDVALIAHCVENRGKIEGKFVGLAGGSEILLKPKGNQRIFIKAQGGDSIKHTGEINALVAELRSASVYDHAICCSGKIEASKTEKKNGRVYLVAENGKTNLDGEVVARGGEVQILGERVFLGDHAVVDVSAKGGGGKVFVGGDYQGLNSEIFNSTDVVVSNGAIVKADAEEFGDGGRIIFWADHSMQHHGEIFARGGSESGDGGFVEVSGFKWLDFQGRCNCLAPSGKVGLLLLDPDSDITISGAATSGVSSSPTPLTYFPVVATGANLLNTTLEAALSSSDVTVTTSGTATDPSANLTVSAGISWSEGTTLTLIARDRVIINGAISCSVSDGEGVLNATGSSVEVNGPSGGSLFVETVNLTATAGQVLIDTTTITAAGGSSESVTIDASQSTAGLDAVSISASTIEAKTLDVTGTVTGGGASGKGIAVASSSALDCVNKVSLVGTGQDDEGINISDSTISLEGNDTFIITGSAVGATTGSLVGVNINTGSAFDTLSVGNMEITGSVTGAAIPGTVGNVGVIVDDSSINSNVGSDQAGSIIISGTGGAGTNSNYGVQISSSSTVGSIAGDIIITGNPVTAPATTGTDNYGIDIVGSGSVTSSGSADITITGTGGLGTSSNFGVRLNSGSVTNVNGQITIAGTPSSGTVTGFQMISSSDIETTGSGGISITSTAERINVNSSTVDSANTLVMSAESSTATNNAIQFSTATISATGTATLTGTKTGGTGVGVEVSSSSVTFGAGGTMSGTSIDGSGILFTTGTFTGNSGTSMLNGTVSSSTGGALSGIFFDSSSSLLGTGNISLTGTNNASGAFTSLRGVFIDDATVTNSGSGIFSFTGTGGAGTTLNHGVEILTATVAATSTGGFTIDGTGGAGTNDNFAVFLNGGATITTSSGDILIEGNQSTLPASTGTDNFGVNINGGASTTTVESTGSGSITIRGQGGSGANSNRGVRIDASGTPDAAAVKSATGPIVIEAEKSSGTNIAFQLLDGALLRSTGSSISVTSSLGDFAFTSPSTVEITGGSGTLTINNTQSGSANPAISFSGTTVSSTGGTAITGIKTGGSGAGVDASGSTITFGTGGSLRGTGVGGQGVILQAATVFTAGSGNASITGRANGSGGFPGFEVDSSTIAGGSGNLTIRGSHGDAAGNSGNRGIALSAATVTQTGSGTMSFIGTGAEGTNLNSGIEMSGISPITVSGGSLRLVGTGGEGTSTDNYGFWIASGSTITGSGSGRVFIEGTGGGGTGDSHGIYLDGATISSTGTGAITCVGTAGSETVSDEGIRIETSTALIMSSTGAISLTGNASGVSTTGIHITDDGTVSSTGSAPITLRTFSDIILDEGGSVLGGGGLVTVESDRDLTITGGSGAATPSGIFLGSGNARITTFRDLTLFGGSGAGSFAQIGAQSDSSANITFPLIRGHLRVNGLNTNSYAIIGHGDPTVGAATFSGNIIFNKIQGEVEVIGATTAGGGAAGFAQIGHVDGAGATLSGDVKFLTRRSLLVLGGTAAASAYARIGHGGQGGGGTFGASVMDLLVGQNIRVRTLTAEAQIVNPSPSSPLILVTDNLNPKPPSFGMVGITQEGTLTANGELRIYTVDRALNTITNPINGEVFTPPALQIDNPQEEFSVYFPDGTFSTASFRIYYKIPIAAGFPHLSLYSLAVVNAQLQDELPIFRYMRLPNYPEYHVNFCGETPQGINCLNNLDPYGSFIFEDNVYWVGGR